MNTLADMTAIYCRLSKEDEDKLNKGDDSESIQNQKLLLMDYAMAQGWSIHKVYSDDDRKGFDRERPAFNQLLQDAEGGKFNIVLCKHQSRFTRDMELVERYLHHEFVEWGVRFVSIVDHVDTNVKGTKKQRQIYGLMNEWYSEDLSENIRAVLKNKVKAGQFIGSFASYGYQKDPKNKHKLIINEETAGIVRGIFDLYLQGNGIQTIANILTDRGVATPSAHNEQKGFYVNASNAGEYSAAYGVWSKSTVRDILKSPVYIGHLVQGTRRKLSYKSKKVVVVPVDEHIVVKNTHEPIVDEKTFYTVNNLLDRKRTVYKPTYGYKGDLHLFAGRLRCLDCGSTMHKGSPVRSAKTYHIRCKLSHKTKSKECTPHSIKLSTLTSHVEKRIREIIDGYMANEDNTNLIIESLNNKSALKKDIASKEREILALERKIQEENSYIAAAFKEKVKGLLTDEDFIDMRATIQAEIAQYKNRKSRLEEEISSLKFRVNSLGDIEGVIKKYINFDELTHEIVNEFIDYIEIGEKTSDKEQEIVIHWLF